MYPRITHAVILALVVSVGGFSLAAGIRDGLNAGSTALRGDMNGDGQTDARDALMILQESAGLVQWARVTRVLDGDTIEVSLDGQQERVRYYSIDAPEPDEPGGPEAKAANERLVQGGVLLYPGPDGRDRDSFGRLLRNVYTPAGLWIEAMLVEGGYAQWR